MAQPQAPYRTSGVVPSSGELTLTFRGRDSAPVRVAQVSVEMSGAAGAACSLRVDGLLVSPLVPTGDAAGGDPPVWLQPGSALTVTWTGAPVGATGTMGVFWDYGTG